MEKLFRALDKVSLLLKINLLIKLVLWSYFGPRKGWQISRAPLGVGGGANGDVPLDGIAFS